MNVLVNLSDDKNKPLEKYRPRAKGGEAPKWTLVVEGFWSGSIYHSYSVCQSEQGCWLLNQCSRNGCLDGVTEEDVEEGALNDDQLQAIHNFGSLKKAQEWEFNMICAVWLDPPEGLTAEDAGRQLYEEFVKHGGTEVEERFVEDEEEYDDDEEEYDEVEEDYPEIGDLRDGLILVCYGDDRPDTWIDWLDTLVTEFEKLAEIAESHSLDLDPGPDYRSVQDWQEFCEAIGVNINSRFWEGSMISGQFQMGWIEPNKVYKAKKIGKAVLKQLRQNLFEKIRNSAILDIKKIKNLDSLIESTLNDRASLIAEIAELNACLTATKSSEASLGKLLSEAKANDLSALTLDCLQMACAILNRDRKILLAGPLVLWDDGIVYALTSCGKVPLPAASPPAVLLRALQQSGHPVVEVGEMTCLGHFLFNGNPIYRRGADHISGWVTVWGDTERNRERKFVVADPNHLAVVQAIHEHFKTSDQPS